MPPQFIVFRFLLIRLFELFVICANDLQRLRNAVLILDVLIPEVFDHDFVLEILQGCVTPYQVLVPQELVDEFSLTLGYTLVLIDVDHFWHWSEGFVIDSREVILGGS